MILRIAEYFQAANYGKAETTLHASPVKKNKNFFGSPYGLPPNKFKAKP